jgi:hypothetical protein
LRFYQRGRLQWVELITESHPTRAPRKVTLSGQIRAGVAGRTIEDFGDVGSRFSTSALSKAPRILFVEEVDSAPAPKSDVAGLEPSPRRRRRRDADRKASIREVVERLKALPPAALDALDAAEARELAQPPRNVVIAEPARSGDPYPDDPWSGLRAFKERVLRNFPDALQQLERRPRLEAVQPLSSIAAQPGKFTAFIDMPLPARAHGLGLAIVCLWCSVTSTTGEVESLNAGWGCDRVDGRDCWYCPTCYGRLVENHPESMAARLWRVRLARGAAYEDALREAVGFLDDVDAVTLRRDADAVDRLTARLVSDCAPLRVRQAVRSGLVLTLAEENAPPPFHRDDGTTLTDEAGQRVRVAPNTLPYPLFRRWLRRRARRQARDDQPDSRRIAVGADIVTLPDPRSNSAEADLVAALDTARALREVIALRLAPRERELLRLLPDHDLKEAAQQTEMSYSSAKTLLARIRRKAEPIRRKYRKNP